MTVGFDKVYWLRVGMGVLGGAIAEQIPYMYYSDGIAVGILVYLVSFYIARYGMFRKIDKQQVGKLYTTGLGVYIGLFVLSWILLFTLSAV